METYKIMRFYSDDRKARKQAGGLTLEQARDWCSKPDTSSKTHPKGRNSVTCDWFDGFVKE